MRQHGGAVVGTVSWDRLQRPCDPDKDKWLPELDGWVVKYVSVY